MRSTSSGNAGVVIAGVVALLAAGVIGWALRGPGASGNVTAGSSPTKGSASAVGPQRTIGGIPVGFAHTEGGAIAAAASYERSVAAASDAGRLGDAMAVLTVAPLRDFARANAAALRQEESHMAGSAGLSVRVWPLGYRVDSYSPTAARVSVWSYQGGSGGAPPRMISDYGASAMTLRWSAGDWKVSTTQPVSYPSPPAEGSTDPQALRTFAVRAAGFQEFADAP